MPISNIRHARIFFRLPSSINTDKKKSIATCNRAINKLVPPYDDNQKIPRNDIALLRHACVDEELLCRKSMPRGPAWSFITHQTDRTGALLWRCKSKWGKKEGGGRGREKERRRNERVLIIFHGLHDRVHAPEVTRATACIGISEK